MRQIKDLQVGDLVFGDLRGLEVSNFYLVLGIDESVWGNEHCKIDALAGSDLLVLSRWVGRPLGESVKVYRKGKQLHGAAPALQHPKSTGHTEKA